METIEHQKLKAKSDLIAALIQYRESAKAAKRNKLAKWAQVALSQVAAFSHVAEDLRLGEAISAFCSPQIQGSLIFAEDMLRDFRKTLSVDEMEALIEAM